MSRKKNNRNTDRKRQYRIYLQSAGKFVDVEEEVFREFYRHIKRERSALQKSGMCYCPQSYIYYCNCECNNCKYSPKSTVSSLELEEEEENINEIDNMNVPNPLDISIGLDIELLQDLIDRLNEIYPKAREIILYRYAGYSDHEISQIINIERKTFEYQLKRALRKLGAKREDYE